MTAEACLSVQVRADLMPLTVCSSKERLPLPPATSSTPLPLFSTSLACQQAQSVPASLSTPIRHGASDASMSEACMFAFSHRLCVSDEQLGNGCY